MTKIRDLKELVPDFELCNQIPPGEFEDSVFGWRYSLRFGLLSNWEVVPRAGNDVDCPAPTLEEIMIDMERSRIAFLHNVFHCSLTTAKWIKELHSYKATDGMLELWLEVNKTYKANKTDKEE